MTLLTANLTTKTATEGKAAWQPPVWTFGEQITIALRLAKNSGGAVIETHPVVSSLKAALGNVDARPTGGTWRLQLGPGAPSGANTTAVLEGDAPASTVAEAINALSAIVAAYGLAKVVSVNGSLLIVFAGGAQVALTVRENRLWPVSLVRATAYPRDARWIHELRLIQTPVAFTSASERVLPPAPEITRIQTGGTTGDIKINEIQQIYVPFEFRGTYYLKMGFARTALLALADGPAEIAAALNKIGTSFAVAETLFQRGNIEFTDDLGGTAQDLLEVVVADAPEGDLTFTLLLDRAELAAMLRRVPVATVPLEVRLVIDGEEIVAFRQFVTIQRPVIFPELEETPQIDWLRPLSPKRYIPYDPSQVLTGQHFFPAVLGNGAATVFPIAHGRGTEYVRVWVRENVSGGRQLIDGTDFEVTIDGANEVTVMALLGAPSVDAWLAIVMSAETVATFANDLTVGIAQVTGLQEQLDAIGANLVLLNQLLPGQASIAGTQLAQGPFTIEFPALAEILFTKEKDAAKLPVRAPFLLPAVHRASVAALPSPLPAPAAGLVWLNGVGAVLIPGGGMIRGSYAAAGDHVASDGRRLYPAIRSGASISYYPAPFVRTLFDVFINDKMFSVGKTLTLQFGVALQLIHASSHAQWVLVIEKGTAPDEVIGSPDTTSLDLQNIVWDTAAPLLRQRLILTPALTTHQFGAVIVNKSAGITANALIYNQVVNANAGAPVAANFSLRARLIEFDTENSVPTALGWVSYRLVSPPSGLLGLSITV